MGSPGDGTAAGVSIPRGTEEKKSEWNSPVTAPAEPPLSLTCITRAASPKAPRLPSLTPNNRCLWLQQPGWVLKHRQARGIVRTLKGCVSPRVEADKLPVTLSRPSQPSRAHSLFLTGPRPHPDPLSQALHLPSPLPGLVLIRVSAWPPSSPPS